MPIQEYLREVLVQACRVSLATATSEERKERSPSAGAGRVFGGIRDKRSGGGVQMTSRGTNECSYAIQLLEAQSPACNNCFTAPGPSKTC